MMFLSSEISGLFAQWILLHVAMWFRMHADPLDVAITETMLNQQDPATHPPSHRQSRR
jgi:hypothetical protein